MAQYRPDQASRIPRSIFRSPSSPASTGRTTSCSMPVSAQPVNDRYSQSLGSRKRPRTDSFSTAVPVARSVEGSVWSDLDASNYSVGTASPAPLANSRYRLAGGLDSPIQQISNQFENWQAGPEDDFRRRWSSTKVGDDERQTIVVGALERERNGGRRVSKETVVEMQTHSWGSFVVKTIGGIAGKVLDFCTAGAFRGFTAGGGTGYAMDGTVPQRIEETHRHGHHEYFDHDDSTPIPGGYPPDAYDDCSVFDPDARPAKRQQTSHGGDWVVVDRPDLRQGPRSSSSYSSPATAVSRSPASRPAPRTSARRPRSSIARLSSVSHSGSPQAINEHRRTASFASPRSPASSPQQYRRSPSAAVVDVDLQRYSAKKQREAKQSNDSMKRLNAQLQAMIKQGKEALASKVEVRDSSVIDGMDEDEGFVEGHSDGEAVVGAKGWF